MPSTLRKLNDCVHFHFLHSAPVAVGNASFQKWSALPSLVMVMPPLAFDAMIIIDSLPANIEDAAPHDY